MEKDGYFGGNGSWQPESNDINSSPLHVGDQLGCFLNLNWDQTANFESALSSLVSSPTSSTPNSVPPSSSGAADSVVIRELIGRLGSICSNSSGAGGEISPPRSHYQSTNTSCYSTPLNSPPKLNLSMIDNQNHHQQLGRVVGAPNHFDPSFAERAVKYSCFGPGMGGPKPGKLSRVSSSQSLKPGALTHSELSKDSPMQQQANEPSASDRMAADASEGNVKKRKATVSSSSKGGRVKTSSAKMIEEENSKAKRSRPASSNGAQKDAEEKDNEKEKEEKENNVKALEPPKDYIHVRARRGQATDSHSLAERVRREKISERMKFLQDLVPGCNKITGKAVMLDEIINYVQSLQRQVEFLSMKLATVNPQLDFNPDNLLTKDTQQPLLSFPLEATSSGFPYANQTQGLATNGLELQCSVNPLLDSNFHRSLSMQLPSLDGLSGAASQLGVFWENDLQSVVQMGFGQNQEAIFSSPNSQGSLPTNQTKIEL